MDETLQLGQLAVGDDAEQDGGGLVSVAACAVEDGHTPVQLAEDGLAQLLRPLADELDLGAALAHHQHLIHDDGVGQDHHDAVQHLRQGAERDLPQHDGYIEDHHGDGDGPVEPFLEHQRRDVHAAGGSPGPDDDGQRRADAKAREDGAQHDVVRQPPACQQPLPQGQKDRAEDAAGEGVEGKGPAQHQPTPRQHGKVEEKQEARDGKPRQAAYGQRDARGTAGDEPGGLQKGRDGQRVERIAAHDGGTVAQKLFAIVYHGCTPCL